jgi:polysaccharide export outer membrane protein
MISQRIARSAFLALALAAQLTPASAQQPAPQGGAGAPPTVATDSPLVADPGPRVGKPATAPTDANPPRRRENYRIGPGDDLDIRVLGEDKMSAGVRVSEDGFIRFPFIDEDLRAQCLTERELGDLIASKLKKYLKYPEVFVAVKTYNSTPVAIIGAVSAPGRFQMQRRVRLIELIAFAGGVKGDAGKVLHIIHVGGAADCDAPASSGAADDRDEPTETVNVSKLMQGDPSADRVMRPGDIVIVPVADLVFVAGEVLKPNAYPLREGMTLTQVLALAGGPSPVAKVEQIRIVRQEAGKPRTEIPVDLKAVQANKTADPLLQANDVIEIPDSTGKKFFRGFVSALGGGASQLPLRVIP